MPSGPPRWSTTIGRVGRPRRQLDQLGQLGVVQPGVVGQARRGPASRTPSWNAPGRAAARSTGSVRWLAMPGLASQATAWRMPRKRPPPAPRWASSTLGHRARRGAGRRSRRCRRCGPALPAPARPPGAAATTNSVSPDRAAARRGPPVAVGRAALDEHRLEHAVAGAGVGQQLVEQVAVLAGRGAIRSCGAPAGGAAIGGRSQRWWCGSQMARSGSMTGSVVRARHSARSTGRSAPARSRRRGLTTIS